MAVWTKGIGFRNVTNRDGIENVSLMGGVPVVIETTGGLDMNAALNTIAVISKNYPQLQFVQPRITGEFDVYS